MTANNETSVWWAGLGLVATAALCMGLPAAASAQAGAGEQQAVACTQGTTIDTEKGPVCGATKDGVTSWLGIPFAAPPVGNLRFASPEPHASWQDVRVATKAGNQCPQPSFGGSSTPTEDCLYLRVQAPADRGDKPLPVMVEIHGGGFMYFGPPSGAHLVKTGDIVYVAMNYRLGIFGFLANKAFGPNPGDYGLQDQQAALRWVQANIARFGGDPHNVTIFGQSAGGASVCAHAVSPTAKGLFEKGISESGFYNSLLGDNNVWAAGDCKSKLPSLAEAEAAGDAFAAKVGCGDASDVAACLRQVPIKTLLANAGGAMNAKGGGTIAPTVNGTTLPMSPGKAFATGHVNKVALMIGADRDEINGGVNAGPVVPQTLDAYRKIVQEHYGKLADGLMEMYPPKRFPGSSPYLAYRTMVADSDSVCPALATFGRLSRFIPVYAWIGENPDVPIVRNKDLPQGAYHDSEDQFNFPHRDVTMTPNQKVYETQINAQWVGFARTGSPVVDGTPLWPRYTHENPAVMSLRPAGDSVITKELAAQHHCDYWDAHLPFQVASR